MDSELNPLRSDGRPPDPIIEWSTAFDAATMDAPSLTGMLIPVIGLTQERPTVGWSRHMAEVTGSNPVAPIDVSAADPMGCGGSRFGRECWLTRRLTRLG